MKCVRRLFLRVANLKIDAFLFYGVNSEMDWIYAAAASHFIWNECKAFITIAPDYVCVGVCKFANSNKMPWQTLIISLWDCSVWITCERLKCVFALKLFGKSITPEIQALSSSIRSHNGDDGGDMNDNTNENETKSYCIDGAGVYFVTCELDFQY